MMTSEEKIQAYKEGRYICPVPEVSTAYWTAESWVIWIDMKGNWRPKIEDLIDAAARIDEMYAGEEMDEFEREVNRKGSE